VTMIENDVVDLAIVVTLGPIAGLRSDRLAPIPLLLVAAPNHPLAGRKAVDAKDLRGQAFVGGLRHSRYMQMVRTALQACGIDDVNVSMEFQDPTSVKEMVRIGAGIAALPACSVEDEINRKALVALPLKTRPTDFELRSLFRLPLAPAARAFRNDLRRRLSFRTGH
jgi:LysR family transcriptional regulator, low CO2-responsive transcriptional regulator